MKHRWILCLASLALASAQAQSFKTAPGISQAQFDASALQGLTLSHKNSQLTVLSNVSLQKAAAPGAGTSANAKNSITAASPLLQKIGPYEIRQIPGAAAAKGKAGTTQSPNANFPTSDTPYLGVAYLHDTRRLGLISKDIAVRFQGGAVPAAYAALSPKELVPNSGLYLVQAQDIGSWIKLVARLQADTPQVALVEPQIKTHFMQPR